MAVIKCSCPACGEQEVFANQVLVTTSDTGNHTYSFTCPDCRQEVVKEAFPAVLHLLSHAPGVIYRHIKVPKEYIETDHSQPPLSEDDLIDFALALRDL